MVEDFVKGSFGDFDARRHLRLASDGISDEAGAICSIIFLQYSMTGTRSLITGFRSARFCNLDEDYGQCFWLENGCTNPTGVGRGGVFLQLIYSWLFEKARASSMYVQVDQTNRANQQIYANLKRLEDDKDEENYGHGFVDITSHFESSPTVQMKHLFFQSTRWEVEKPLSQAGIASLNPGQKVRSDVVDYVLAKFNSPEALVLSSHFPGLSHDSQQRCLEKSITSLVKRIYLPICNSNHWFLLVIDVDTKTFFLFDSLAQQRSLVFTRQLKSSIFDNIDQFKTFKIQQIFKRGVQTNSFDCGIFVCEFSTWAFSSASLLDECDVTQATVAEARLKLLERLQKP